MVPKGVVMFERKGKVQKAVPWDVYAFLVCGHEPPCLPCEVRGQPTPSLPPFEEEGGPEDEVWPEAAPTHVADVMSVLDPCWETPQGETKFDLAKWGMVLPPIGEGESPHLSARELKQIARAVHTACFPQGQDVGVNSIFVSQDQEEDLRVEAFRQALLSHYDGVVMCTELLSGSYPDTYISTDTRRRSPTPKTFSASGRTPKSAYKGH